MEHTDFSTLPTEPHSAITILGAREHNLKNIHLTLPKGALIVFTGPSGSGKSSLAFDTLYAEGQRRYVESLSAYARQFLDQMSKPDVDRIDGLAPAISIDQKTTANNPRSTVGTITEIYDYLRLLFARVGTAYSPATGLPIAAQTRPQMVERIEKMPVGTKYMLLAPIARSIKGEFRKELDDLRKRGYQRVQIDDVLYDLDGSLPPLVKNKRHNISVVVDRLVQNDLDGNKDRLMASLETALVLGHGVITIQPVASDEGPTLETFTLSSQFACPESGFTLEEIEPRLFSFNNPFGACPSCSGLGVPEWGVAHYGDDQADITRLPACDACNGFRLKPQALCVKISGDHIGQVCQRPIDEIFQWCQKVPQNLNTQQLPIAERILREIHNRLCFLLEVGLGYLSLSRGSGTLSGGESQRIRLASQVGSGLTGVLYVLDEPSIGLHQRDNAQLLKTLTKLKELGNTVIVVEHDEDAIRLADYVVDFGPGAGRFGGEICAQGSLQTILDSPNSITGDYLTGRKCVPVPTQRRTRTEKCLRIVNATANNLNNLTVEFPLGMFICVTGVSGSGKSSLVMDTLKEGLEDHCNKNPFSVLCDRIEGTEHIDKLVSIDQSPIGRTPRSNPATYTGVFTPIREWYSFLPQAKALGYGPGRFSFNVKGGRCEACEGDGVLTIAMHFLPDIQVPCEACKGKRYSYDTLAITYKGKSIADVLAMSTEEAALFFEAIPSIAHRLNTLVSVGLGYVHIGQSAPTLSGGEAQRVKLAKELSRRSTGKTVYILDEPTTGLHFHDVKVLLEVLHRLVEQGNTVIVIEHNLEVIKTADWIIDIGPEGGHGGGQIVAQGEPEKIAATPGSYTGYYLAPLLKMSSIPPLESKAGVL
jgi:excinuclease ABC subunit A